MFIHGFLFHLISFQQTGWDLSIALFAVNSMVSHFALLTFDYIKTEKKEELFHIVTWTQLFALKHTQIDLF